MLTTFCPNCGSALEEGTAFCPACGATAQQPGAAYEQPYQRAYQAPQPSGGVPGRGKGIVSMILGINGLIESFILLMACANLAHGGVWFVFTAAVFAVFPILALCLGSSARQQGYTSGVTSAALITGAIGLVMVVLALMMGFASLNV